MSNPSTTRDILLDAGTNELEVLVFRLAGSWCGVNVAKVREVLRGVELTKAPRMHPSVEGMFNMRGTVVPVVDLGRHLGLCEGTAPDADLASRRIIITEFNGFRAGFLVASVEQIYRMSWSDVRPVPELSTLVEGAATYLSICTGIVEVGERLVLMLDFESVADAILLQERLHVERVENTLGVERSNRRVIFVEDSPFMRELVRKVFLASGYTGIEIHSDGAAAWEAIEASLTDGSPRIEAVVSDIEMPRMDGLHLTKKIKSHPGLGGVPVILFSSLISADNLKKGKQVGADVQVAKPELAAMVLLVDRVLRGDRELALAAA